MRQFKFISLSVLFAAFGLTLPANADPITGTLNITGSVDVTATTLDWRPPPGGGFGTFTTKDPGTEYFSTVVSGDALNPVAGDQLDLSLVPATPGFTDVAIGDTFVDDWFSNFRINNPPDWPGYDYSNLTFDLTHVVDPSLGVVAQCNGTENTTGQTCYLGAFLLTVGDDGVGILLEVRGFFQDSTVDGCGMDCLWEDSFYKGAFTTQLAGFTVAQVLDILEFGGTDPNCDPGVSNGTICSSYSANFVPQPLNEVPEPASLLLLGTGALALGYRRRRAAAKARV